LLATRDLRAADLREASHHIVPVTDEDRLPLNAAGP